jgi:hypothetical protein
MTRPTQGTGGPDGRPRCYNVEPMREYVANDGTEPASLDTVAQRVRVIPWAFSTGCKSWAGHPGTDPVPLAEGWRCEGCRLLPRLDVSRALNAASKRRGPK